MMHTKIVGVTFRNKNNFKRLLADQELELRPEMNQYDEYAVAVHRKDNDDKLGYLPAKQGLARDIHDAMSKGLVFLVKVSKLTGEWTSRLIGRKTLFWPGEAFGINISLESVFQARNRPLQREFAQKKYTNGQFLTKWKR